MASKSTNKFSGIAVVVPMYNEEVGARKCVNTLLPYIKKLKVRSTLIVVNDGSSDKTPDILRGLKKKYIGDFHLVDHSKNQGYGEALKTGSRSALSLGYKYVIFMDSDLTNDPKYLTSFADLYNEDWDCIKASRYIKGGGVNMVPLKRRIISIVAQQIASNLFRVGIKDCTNGFRMVKTIIHNKLNLKENGFSIIVEELCQLKKLNATFTEIPYILTARVNTKSSFSYSHNTIKNYLKYIIKAFFI